jgi:hypothetical protein
MAMLLSNEAEVGTLDSILRSVSVEAAPTTDGNATYLRLHSLGCLCGLENKDLAELARELGGVGWRAVADLHDGRTMENGATDGEDELGGARRRTVERWSVSTEDEVEQEGIEAWQPRKVADSQLRKAAPRCSLQSLFPRLK